MKEKIVWSSERILVIGLGASGLAAALALKRLGAEVVVRDESIQGAVIERARQLAEAAVRVELGEENFGVSEGFTRVLLSPGVPPERTLVRAARSSGASFWSELELGWHFCCCPVVAITGTNGKTTTTELSEHLLREGGKRALACGNIGLPFTEASAGSEGLDVMVVEASSFQLEEITSFHPRVAALLNITPDHMDRYATMAEYKKAKLEIFKNQGSEDFAILHADFADLPLAAKVTTFSARGQQADYQWEDGWIVRRGESVFDLRQTVLRGPHNAENAMVACEIASIYGVSDERVQQGLQSFALAAHRCEVVTEVGGVLYINDSKATNPDAVEMAIRSTDRPVVLIAGGKDKGFGFESIAEVVAARTRAVILIGETADRIAHDWEKVACQRASSLQEAVEIAARVAEPGDAVLLSPGCSSFDMFRSYSDRGDQFKSLVRQMRSGV